VGATIILVGYPFAPRRIGRWMLRGALERVGLDPAHIRLATADRWLEEIGARARRRRSRGRMLFAVAFARELQDAVHTLARRVRMHEETA